MTQVAVIGLGAMGLGMAKSCVAAGLKTFGRDIVPAQIEALKAAGGNALNPAALGACDVALLVVLNAEQTQAVLFGEDGIAAALPKGAVVLSSATVAPDFARKMADQAQALGLEYLDAPISGGAVKAANGALSVMASGPSSAFDKARPVLDAIANDVFELGDAIGAGSAMKAINQILVGTHIATMAEAMTFGVSQGIPPAQALEVISKCAGTSWAFENRGQHLVDGDYTPLSAVDIWLKDLGIVLDIARQSKFSAPMTASALQQFIAASGMGLGREDDAAVAKVYARNAGLTLPGETP